MVAITLADGARAEDAAEVEVVDGASSKAMIPLLPQLAPLKPMKSGGIYPASITLMLMENLPTPTKPASG